MGAPRPREPKAALFRELHPKLLRYLRAQEPGEAEDLASERWLDVASSLRRFAGDELAFRRFIFTIARSAGNPASAASLQAPGTVGAVRADDLAEALEELGLGPSAQVVDDALLRKRADEILLERGFNTMGRDGKIKVPSKGGADRTTAMTSQWHL